VHDPSVLGVDDGDEVGRLDAGALVQAGEVEELLRWRLLRFPRRSVERCRLVVLRGNSSTKITCLGCLYFASRPAMSPTISAPVIAFAILALAAGLPLLNNSIFATTLAMLLLLLVLHFICFLVLCILFFFIRIPINIHRRRVEAQRLREEEFTSRGITP